MDENKIDKVMKNEKLDVYAKIIYVYVLRQEKDDNSECRLSYADIAKNVGCSVRKAQYSVNFLIEHNHLKKQQRYDTNTRGKLRNAYSII